jgi:protein-S-isoprenylcysteine O-methyltransferase Ste14
MFCLLLTIDCIRRRACVLFAAVVGAPGTYGDRGDERRSRARRTDCRRRQVILIIIIIIILFVCLFVYRFLFLSLLSTRSCV